MAVDFVQHRLPLETPAVEEVPEVVDPQAGFSRARLRDQTFARAGLDEEDDDCLLLFYGSLNPRESHMASIHDIEDAEPLEFTDPAHRGVVLRLVQAPPGEWVEAATLAGEVEDAAEAFGHVVSRLLEYDLVDVGAD